MGASYFDFDEYNVVIRYTYKNIYICLGTSVKKWMRQKKSPFKLITVGLNSGFSFFLVGCFTRAKNLSLPYYLPIFRNRKEINTFPSVYVFTIPSVNSGMWHMVNQLPYKHFRAQFSELFAHTLKENRWVYNISKSFSPMWNVNSLVQDLNSFPRSKRRSTVCLDSVMASNLAVCSTLWFSCRSSFT